MKNKTKIPFITTLVGALLTFATIFLPYVAVDSKYKEILEYASSDMMNVSLFKYFLTYTSSEYKLLYSGFTTLIIAIAVFVFLTILFAIFKKPIPTIIFNVLAIGVFIRQSAVYEKMGIGTYYNWSIGYYFFYVTAIITLVGAIWLLVAKKQVKKEMV